jgi:flagellar basal body-associated protein FliL
MNQEEQKSKKKRGIILWIIIFLLMGSNAVLVWLYMQEKDKLADKIVEIKTIYVEKETVEADLAALQADYGNLQTNNKALQSEIEEKKKYIEELIIEAKKNKGNAYIIAKLKKETETLRAIMQHYVVTIDSLNTLNQKLIVDKKNVLKELDAEKEKGKVLNQEKDELKETIAKGSILSCFNVSAKGVYFKKGGKKEVESKKARKCTKIKVGFSLGENKIAKAGEKTVYVRIMTPDGKEMAKSYDDSYRFVFNKTNNGYYAGKETVNYGNVELSAVTYCEGQGEMVPGNYIIEISCDGAVIGNTNLKLD